MKQKPSLPPLPFLALATTLPVIGLTFISPAITILRDDLNVTAEQAQLVLSVYLFSSAFGQILVGPISDRFGRKPTLFIGAILFFLGAMASALAPNIMSLLLFRLVQGLGAACCMTVARTIVTDCLTKQKAAGALSIITAMMATIPIITIAIGGITAYYLGWRFNVWVLTFISFILILCNFFFLHETNFHKVEKIRIISTIKNIGSLFKIPLFSFNLIITSMQVGLFYALNGFMPYQFYLLGASPAQFGFYFAVCSIGYLFGNILNKKLTHIYSIEILTINGTILSLIVIVFMGLLPALYPHPAMLSLPLFFFGIANGMAVNNSMIGGMIVAGRYSGTATGLIGAGQVTVGGIAGAVIIALGGDSSLNIGLAVMFLLASISIICALIVYRLHRQEISNQ